ncbi:MAG: HAD-IA family hydrolase, partial [Devosia sp.]
PTAYPRAVLFDLDGTLIDSVPDITLAVAELMATEGLEPFPESDVRVMVGHGLRVLVQRALRARGRDLEPAALEAVIARMFEIYPRHLTGRTALLPGVVECLAELRANGCVLGLVTNKLQSAAVTVLEHFGLSENFVVTIGDQVRRSVLAPKPKPDMLLFALSRMKVAPPDAIMVGDSSADMEAAADAGIFSVALRNGYSSVPLETLNPGFIIDTLIEMARGIEAWRHA